MKPYEFQVSIEPRRSTKMAPKDTFPFGLVQSRESVYDIKVTDAANGNLLVFSNQGYENRQDAHDVAVKLFSGRPALLVLRNAKGGVDAELQLDTL